MTETTQRNSRKFPCYKLCCLIPQEDKEDQNQTVYLSSASELNRFLKMHGMDEGQYRVDYGRKSTSTCTEDLPNVSEVVEKEQDKKIPNEKGSLIKRASSHISDVVTFHRCNKDESLIHLCKKSNLIASKYVENNKTEGPTVKNQFDDKTSLIVSDNLKIISKNIKTELKQNSTKTVESLKSGSFINFFRKNKNKLVSPSPKMNQNVSAFGNNRDDSFDSYDNLNKNVSFLSEAVSSEAAMELKEFTGHREEVQKVIAYDLTEINVSHLQEVKCWHGDGLASEDDESYAEDVKKVIAYDLEVSKSQQPNPGQLSLKLCHTSKVNNEPLDVISNESFPSNLNCVEDSKAYPDQSFYHSPTNFIEEMADCVMKYFIDKESDASWLEEQKDKKIPKKSLGIDKSLSELHILKKIAKHHPADCLLSHLTPRQKRLLVSGIFETLQEFNITGHRWGELAHAVLKRVCKIFKNQRKLII